MKLGFFIVGYKTGSSVARTFLGESKTLKANSKTWFLSSIKQWQGIYGELNLPKVSLWLRKPNFLGMQVQGSVVSRVLNCQPYFWVCHWPCVTRANHFNFLLGFYMRHGGCLDLFSHSLKKAIHPGKEQRVQGAREAPRMITDSKSFPSGNSQW